MNLVTLAGRNIIRTRHRTWVTIGAMAFAGAIMIYYAALMEGVLRATEKNAIAMELGHCQIHAAGYRDDPDLYTLINDPDRILALLDRQGLSATPRLFGVGLAASGTASAGVLFRGLDLDREPRVTELNRHLLLGRWLRPEAPGEIVIGRKLARTLGVSLNDEIVILGQAADGSMANELYIIGGILKSVGQSIDRGGVLMSAAAFRELMVLPDGVHEIAVRLPDPATDLDAATAMIAGLVPELEVKNWRQLQPVVARIVDLSRSSLIIMLVITYAAVGILTLNAMLMSVFERIREFGIMKALGFSPWRVVGLIVSETMIMVTGGAILAMTFGVPLAWYTQTHPLDLTFLAPTSSTIAGVAIDPVWYCQLTMESVVLPVLFLYLMSLAALIYPATKAALIRPVRAIHHR